MVTGLFIFNPLKFTENKTNPNWQLLSSLLLLSSIYSHRNNSVRVFPTMLTAVKTLLVRFFYLDECGVFSPKFLYFGSKYHEFQMKLKMAKSIDVCTYGLHTRGHACTKSTHKTSGCSNPTKLNFTWEIVNICVPTKLKKKLVLYKMILGVIESSSRTLGDA